MPSLTSVAKIAIFAVRLMKMDGFGVKIQGQECQKMAFVQKQKGKDGIGGDEVN